MKSVRLSENQLQAMSSIAKDIGQAFFISAFIPFLVGVAEPTAIVVILTLINSIGFWIIAVALVGGKKK